LNTIDLSCFIVLGVSALAGVVRGFTREVLGISAWAGATFTAYMTSPYVEQFIDPFMAKKTFLFPVSLGISFVLSLIVLSLISRSIAQSIRFSTLSGLDRTLGLGFGVVRGALLLCAIYLIVGFFISENRYPESFQTSRMRFLLAYGVDQLELNFPVLKSLRGTALSPQKSQGDPLVTPAPGPSPTQPEGIPNLEEDLKGRMTPPFQPSERTKETKTGYPYQPQASEQSTLDKVVQTLSQLKAQADQPPAEKKTKYDISQRYSMDRLMKTQEKTDS
jgi:membrane protein required for colicin V production